MDNINTAVFHSLLQQYSIIYIWYNHGYTFMYIIIFRSLVLYHFQTSMIFITIELENIKEILYNTFLYLHYIL